jgi:hypothetical protein
VPLGFQCYGFDHTGLSTHMTDIKEAWPTRGLGHLQGLHAMEKPQALAAPEPLPPRSLLLCLSCQDWAPVYFHHPGCKCELSWLLEHIVARMWTVSHCWITLQHLPQILLLQLTLDTIVALLTSLPMMYHVDLWNFNVFQRIHLSSLVT